MAFQLCIAQGGEGENAGGMFHMRVAAGFQQLSAEHLANAVVKAVAAFALQNDPNRGRRAA